MPKAGPIPGPPAFLDPLTEITSSYYYAVPKYCTLDHCNCRWLLAMMRSNRMDKIRRKMELQPYVFRTYYQLPDYPQLYDEEDPMAEPLFHRQAVLYLSVLGVAMYLKKPDIVKLLLEYRTPNDERLYSIKDPQYASHVQDSIDGDFNAFPLYVVMMRSGCYDYARDMLAAGWMPNDPLCMPARRRFERRAFYYWDWLDYALTLMHDRPMLPLSRLVGKIINDPLVYRYKRLPMSMIQPKTDEDRVPMGLLDVDDLPADARMLGVRSVLQIAEDYSVYMQMKKRHKMIKDCIRKMACDGVNPEVMMARAQDFDGGYDPSGENNNAASGKKAKKVEPPFISEPSRILLHAMICGTKVTNKVPLHPLLDAVAVYIRRNFYLILPLPTATKRVNPAQQAEQLLQIGLRKRDARNSIAILLNIMQQQFSLLDAIDREQMANRKPKFKHLDPARQASNKRVALTQSARRINRLLFDVLLYSGELIDFLEADQFPPYTDEVDFPIDPKLATRLPSIQMQLRSDLSASKVAPSYLSKDDLLRGSQIKEVFLNLKVGNPPPADKAQKYLEAMTGKRKPKNASNNPSADQDDNPNPNPNNACEGQLCYLFPQVVASKRETPGHVTFLKVKRRNARQQPHNQQKADEEDSSEKSEEPMAEKEPELDQQSTDDDGQNESSDRSDQIAATLSGQIEQLRRSGTPADVAAAAIYQRILDDLRRIAATSASGPADKAKAKNRQGVADKTWAVKMDEKMEAEVEDSSCNYSRARQNRAEIRGRRGGATPAAIRARFRTVRGVGAQRRGNHHNNQHHASHTYQWYQKARVYDAPQGGAEFDLDSP